MSLLYEQHLSSRMNMDNIEAKKVLAEEMARYRAMPYAELILLLDQNKHIDTVSSSGTNFQIDVQVMWDDESKGALRIVGVIDDGGWRAFAPLTADFILRPDGTFIGE
jgi:hypothetical protein